ncbi:alpha/beta hydrolase family protein [Motilimonas cestriensis]|uniref:alpha/beta hydrolase family protein n=1 Tax=Motilimonas cestriensis TaxID=2742685 RepID=UPI003DA5C32C
MNRFLKMALLPLVRLLSACSNALDNILFDLVPHPQEPQERQYNIRQVEFVNPTDGTLLAGELTYPTEGESFPAVVLISGHESGAPPASRNDEIAGHQYFLVISHLLTQRGYAVLRYDNRGVGDSTGDYMTASDNEFSADAAAALKWLRESSNIRLTSSGFLGHSQGGIKALLAAEIEPPDFIISLAGISVETTAQAVVRQNQEINRANGIPQSLSDLQVKELTDIFEILRISSTKEQAQSLLREYTRNAGITDVDHIQNVVDQFGSNWWFTEAHRDIKPLIKKYRGPVLALFGAKDLLVSAAINEAPTRHLLRHPQSEVHTFDHLNHLFQTAKKGTGPQEYWEIETTIEEYVIEKIDDWTTSINSMS